MRFLLSLLVLALSFPALAQDGAITVDKASLYMPKGLPLGGLFMTITNNGTRDDELIAAKSALSDRTELHWTDYEDGMVKMRKADSFDIPAGETVTLSPQQLHIMIVEPKENVQEKISVPVTLVFKRAGEKVIAVESVSQDELAKRFPPVDPRTLVKKPWKQKIGEKFRKLIGKDSAVIYKPEGSPPPPPPQPPVTPVPMAGVPAGPQPSLPQLPAQGGAAAPAPAPAAGMHDHTGH